MKTYRKAVADAYVLKDVLEYLARQADSMAEEVARYREYAEQGGEGDNDYYRGEAAECEAKAAAFERLLEKLSK